MMQGPVKASEPSTVLPRMTHRRRPLPCLSARGHSIVDARMGDVPHCHPESLPSCVAPPGAGPRACSPCTADAGTTEGWETAHPNSALPDGRILLRRGGGGITPFG